MVTMDGKKIDKLNVVESEWEYSVVYGDSEEDWVAKFNKAWADAKEWAHHMADVYNDRISD
ncbi:hypothetical protein CVD25_22790 [Bacillus canaveralius]|uniref:Uncharacterized protein n=1 Tax=Bacillus canaveralius TaxID=1403243 RepID=A0A2N5GGA2_9BACI|nr:hypothetical protein [Bacillus canaveralius]PLR79787.1 hypothetical protein CU635_21140 [Bacillus canaveralius]PLR88286.1 hypothetical protein CVD25_22790 [Bacillus canaveralius]